MYLAVSTPAPHLDRPQPFSVLPPDPRLPAEPAARGDGRSRDLDRLTEELTRQLAVDGSGAAEATGLAVLEAVRAFQDAYRVVEAAVTRSAGNGPLACVIVVERRADRGERAKAATARLGLTDREAQVAALLADRRTNTEIAAALGISPHTARRHTEAVLAKLGISSRTRVAEALEALAGGGSTKGG